MSIETYEREREQRMKRLDSMMTISSFVMFVGLIGVSACVGRLSHSNTIGWLTFWTALLIDGMAWYAFYARRYYR